MSEAVYLASLAFIFGTILAVFAMKYFSAAYQARARRLGDEAYRDLAEKAAAAQSQNTVSLSAIQTQVAEMGTRLITIEKVLKDV